MLLNLKETDGTLHSNQKSPKDYDSTLTEDTEQKKTSVYKVT